MLKEKTKISSLCYNAMFKAVFYNNKYMLSRLVQAILDYLELDINVINKELDIKNNELSLNNIHNKALICDYYIKINDVLELNIEVNKRYYPGLEERNIAYCFKIYGDHFRSGDKYNKFKQYLLFQINFNNYKNPDREVVNEFYIIDTKNHKNYLTKNVCFINVDIEECFKMIYNEDKRKEMSDLFKFGALLKTTYLEDISYILEKVGINMEEKNKFMNDVVEKSKDEEILTSMKFEDSLDYRFELVEEDALKRGLEQGLVQGLEQKTNETIIAMYAKNMSIEDMTDITGKSKEEIKKIINSLNNE